MYDLCRGARLKAIGKKYIHSLFPKIYMRLQTDDSGRKVRFTQYRDVLNFIYINLYSKYNKYSGAWLKFHTGVDLCHIMEKLLHR